MYKLILIISAVFFALPGMASQLDNCPQQGLVALVPGTFNSITPGNVQYDSIHNDLDISPYFSIEILNVFRQQGFGVMVIKSLNPLGDFNANGNLTAAELDQWYQKNCQPKTPIFIIAHSSGGFYALKAVQLRPQLPVQKIIMLATPLEGVQLANKAFHSWFFGNVLKGLISSFSWVFDLRGLEELTSANVEDFLHHTVIRNDVKIYTSFGSAPRPPSLKEALQAEYLSPIFNALSRFIDGDSDGIIEVPTSLGQNALIRLNGGDLIHAQILPDFIHLDHSKQVIDYRVFALLGTENAEFIRNEQHRFYSQLLPLLR